MQPGRWFGHDDLQSATSGVGTDVGSGALSALPANGSSSAVGIVLLTEVPQDRGGMAYKPFS